MRPILPRPRQLFISFFSIGCFAFGGGYAILPLIENETVTKHGWCSMTEITGLYALAQSVPGVIAINVAALIGCRIAGKRGGLAAMAGVILPAFLVILLIASLLPEFQDNHFVAAALRGIRPVVAALILRAAVKIGRIALKDALTWGLAGVALFLMLFFGAKPFWLILGSAAAGVAMYLVWRKMALKIAEKEELS